MPAHFALNSPTMESVGRVYSPVSLDRGNAFILPWLKMLGYVAGRGCRISASEGRTYRGAAVKGFSAS